MNKEIERKDEIIRQKILEKNREIISDPEKLKNNKLININDPKNFPDPLPELTDKDLKRWVAPIVPYVQ